MSLPKPPDGYRLVTAEEKEKPADTEALFWNSMTGSWETREPHKTGTPYRNYTHYAIPIEDAAPGTPDKDGWVEWNPPFNAGDCPVPTDKEVEVRQRNGNIAIVRAGRGKGGPAFWVNEDSGQDIVAYRIVTPTKEEKPDPHAEVKAAFAAGKKVEFRIPDFCDWKHAGTPSWNEGIQYRIAPEVVPDVPAPPVSVQSYTEQCKQWAKDMWPEILQLPITETSPAIAALTTWRSLKSLINQPTPNTTNTTNENNDMSLQQPPVQLSYAFLPRVGSKWALKNKEGTGFYIGTIIAASGDSVTIQGKGKTLGVIPLTEWQERTKNELLSRRERKRRLTSNVPVPACLQAPPTSFVTIRALWTLTKAVPYVIGLITTAKWAAPWAVAAYYYLTAKLGW